MVAVGVRTVDARTWNISHHNHTETDFDAKNGNGVDCCITFDGLCARRALAAQRNSAHQVQAIALIATRNSNIESSAKMIIIVQCKRMIAVF